MTRISYTEALRTALGEELARDPAVLLMGEDIGAYGSAFGVTRGLLEQFGPERVIDTPISEGGFVGLAVGASLVGSRPVVEIMFMDFIMLTLDQMANQAAKLRYVLGEQARCPLVLRTPAGGGRCYGPTHSQSLEGLFFQIPGIKIAVPATPADARGLLKTSIRDDNPVLIVEHKMLYGEKGSVDLDADGAVPFGRANLVAEGDDATIVTWSRMTIEALLALPALDEEEITADVIDMRTLCPLDMDTVIESVKRTGRVLIVDEGTHTGGVSAEIGCRIAEAAADYLDAPVRRLTTPDIPLSASPPLEQAALPDSGKIVEAVRELVEMG